MAIRIFSVLLLAFAWLTSSAQTNCRATYSRICQDCSSHGTCEYGSEICYQQGEYSCTLSSDVSDQQPLDGDDEDDNGGKDEETCPNKNNCDTEPK